VEFNELQTVLFVCVLPSYSSIDAVIFTETQKGEKDENNLILWYQLAFLSCARSIRRSSRTVTARLFIWSAISAKFLIVKFPEKASAAANEPPKFEDSLAR
jgi:hypothetical protein